MVWRCLPLISTAVRRTLPILRSAPTALISQVSAALTMGPVVVVPELGAVVVVVDLAAFDLASAAPAAPAAAAHEPRTRAAPASRVSGRRVAAAATDLPPRRRGRSADREEKSWTRLQRVVAARRS